MNGFHVNVIGWVLIFNARILGPRESEEVSGLWGALVHAYAEDKSQTPTVLRIMQPRSIPLSEKSLGAFVTLVDRLAALHLKRFGWVALRARRDLWAVQSVLCLLLGILGARWLPTTVPVVKEAVVAFFLLGLIFVVPTVTLWRVASAVKLLTANRAAKREVLQGQWDRSTQFDVDMATVGARDRSHPAEGREPRRRPPFSQSRPF